METPFTKLDGLAGVAAKANAAILRELDKRTETRPLPTGSLAEHSVTNARAAAPTLNQHELQALHKLALQCEQMWNCDHDIEWAFARDGTLHLLQHRPTTTPSPRLTAQPGR